MKTRLGAALCVACCTLLYTPTFAHTRVYLMRGLGGLLLSDAMDQIGAKLRRPGIVVNVGDWSDASRFALDAEAHPHDRDVLIGHSMGARAAGEIGTLLKSRGLNVKVIGIDPLFTGALVGAGVDAICFYGQGWPMQGAHNVLIQSSYGHIGYGADPRVQSRVIAAALGGDALLNKAH